MSVPSLSSAQTLAHQAVVPRHDLQCIALTRACSSLDPSTSWIVSPSAAARVCVFRVGLLGGRALMGSRRLWKPPSDQIGSSPIGLGPHRL